MAADQAATHHPPRRGRVEVAEGPRQRLPDAHQSYFAGSHGDSATAPVALRSNAEEEHPVTRRAKASVTYHNGSFVQQAPKAAERCGQALWQPALRLPQDGTRKMEHDWRLP